MTDSKETEMKDCIFSQPTTLCDVVLTIEDKNLHVNKSVLSVVSPVFNAMFNGSFKEGSTGAVRLPGKVYDDFVQFLMCIYPSTVKPVKWDNLDILLPLAEEYQVDSLKERCDAYIVNTLKHVEKNPTVSYLVHLLVLCGRYNLKQATELCVELASGTRQSVLKAQPDFVEVSTEVKMSLAMKQTERYEKAVDTVLRDLNGSVATVSAGHSVSGFGFGSSNSFTFAPRSVQVTPNYCSECKTGLIQKLKTNLVLRS